MSSPSANRGLRAALRGGIHAAMRRIVATALTAALAALALPACAYTVIEYYDATLDHYFMTPLPNEIEALDSGQIAGWSRTGRVFDAYPSTVAANGAAVNPVCRFYIPPQHGDSHFFSASPDECAAVLAKIATDPDFSGYIEETPAEFYIALPDTATGACLAGTVPVYRLWNHRADSNHRYTADLATRNAMIALGYIPEGYGPLGVAMCTPRAGISDSQVRVTGTSPFPPDCDGAPVTGVAYLGAEVEPMIAIDPRNPSQMIGVFQQDRWSDGGARGLRTAYSADGGLTWALTQAAFSHCTGGNAANSADYARASDPWVSIAPDGIAYQAGIAFNGATFATGSSGAVLASRSLDGGHSWGAPIALIVDGATAFDDKDSITADPQTSGYAYAVWDHLTPDGHGPTYLARTTDGGQHWEAARPIYDPGPRNQTLNNQVVGTGAGSLLDFFTEFDVVANNTTTTHLAFVRSTDNGATWSGAMPIADIHALGTHDPQNPARVLRDGATLGSVAAGPGGEIVAVWQDSRFSLGAIDGIALSRSLDGGATWSAPVQVNRVPSVQALLPAVSIRADGTIAVFYYDMRNDTPDPATLLVDAWLATSTDGVTWAEVHVAGPFDFDRAPLVEGGLFIGDYQGLTAATGDFTAFYAQTNPDPSNPTDIDASGFRSIGSAAKTLVTPKAEYRARTVALPAMTADWKARLEQTVVRTLASRRHGAQVPVNTPQAPASWTR